MFKKFWIKFTYFLVVFVAFVDGILLAEEWQTKKNQSSAVKATYLEDLFERKSSSQELTESLVSDIPFTTQAPYGWFAPWTEMAEEASVYMAERWALGGGAQSTKEVTDRMLTMKTWEESNLGTYKNTDALQTLRLLTEFSGLQAEVSYDVNREGLLSALERDQILLVPVNGQKLDNPYYTQPGPEHNMVLIYRYEDENFIAHDPGTLRGEGIHYAIQKILEALQDLNGEKRVILISHSTPL